MDKRTMIAAILAFLLAAGSTQAYVLEGFSWTYFGINPTVDMKINPNCADPSAPDELQALQNAMATWTNCPASFNYNYAGSTTITNYTYNGQNEMCWNPGSSGGALATTNMWYQGMQMLESDCVFWDSWTWSTAPNPGFLQFDVESVALHELGHTVGLAHSQYGQAVMWYSINYMEVQRTLDQDDIDGIVSIYGSMPPALDVTLEPVNPPIVIPAQGGSFQFNASVCDLGPFQQAFVVWARIKNPDGSFTGLTLGPVTVNPPVGQTVTRLRTQSVPGTWPAGQYAYIGYGAMNVSYPAIDSSYFNFTKSADMDGGPTVWEAACTGEPFPEEEAISNQPSAFSLSSVSPNPFNPTTAINYQLQTASQVKLTVWDTAGRLVATLVDSRQGAGQHSVTFDGSKLASGVYLYTLAAGQDHAAGKLLLVK